MRASQSRGHLLHEGPVLDAEQAHTAVEAVHHGQAVAVPREPQAKGMIQLAVGPAWAPEAAS